MSAAIRAVRCLLPVPDSVNIGIDGLPVMPAFSPDISMKTPALLATLFAIATSAVHAAGCSVPNSSTPQLREVIERAGGWPISDAKCAFLNKNNLYVAVTANASVLAGASVGWAHVMLVSEGNVRSDQSRTSTHVNSGNASTPKAEELMVEAVRQAIAGLDFDLAARQIADYERKAKQQ